MTFTDFLDAHFTGLLTLAHAVILAIVACNVIWAAADDRR